MGILQKKCRTTGKKALAYRGKGGQNTGTPFPALRLWVVRYLLNCPNKGDAIVDKRQRSGSYKELVARTFPWFFRVFPRPLLLLPPRCPSLKGSLGGLFGYFLFFLCSGQGRGVRGARNRGGSVFYWTRRRGGGGAKGREGVCGELGGGGANFFVFGAETPTKLKNP